MLMSCFVSPIYQIEIIKIATYGHTFPLFTPLCVHLIFPDPPRKRIDSRTASSPQMYLQRARWASRLIFDLYQLSRVTSLYCAQRSQSIGSANLDQIPPRSPRLSVATTPNYSPSTTGYYTYTSATPPPKGRKISYAGTESIVQGTSTLQPPPPGNVAHPASPWKRKLSKTMKHLVVSPRFHRKRYEASESPGSEGGANSPQLPKRSWFSNFLSEREKVEVVAVFRDKSFTELKASIFRAFDVRCLIFCIVSSSDSVVLIWPLTSDGELYVWGSCWKHIQSEIWEVSKTQR